MDLAMQTSGQPANMDSMPDEILSHIFSYLDTDDLLTMATVCWRWRSQCLYLARLCNTIDCGDREMNTQDKNIYIDNLISFSSKLNNVCFNHFSRDIINEIVPSIGVDCDTLTSLFIHNITLTNFEIYLICCNLKPLKYLSLIASEFPDITSLHKLKSLNSLRIVFSFKDFNENLIIEKLQKHVWENLEIVTIVRTCGNSFVDDWLINNRSESYTYGIVRVNDSVQSVEFLRRVTDVYPESAPPAIEF